VWSYDFVFDWCANGQKLKCLTVSDEWTREGLAIEVDGRLRSGRVIEVLSRLVSERGAPLHLRSDNGPEFVSRALLKWIVDHGIDTALIDPGKPWQNGAAESFNGKFRDECLSLEWFRSRAEAKVVIESWRRHYNEVRPHSSLGYLTPAAFAAKIRSTTQRPRERRGGPLRYMEPPRSAPSRNRPARGNRRQQQGWSSQVKRGPKKPGRSVVAPSISISAHRAPRTSLVRVAVRIRNSKASFPGSLMRLSLKAGNKGRHILVSKCSVVTSPIRLLRQARERHPRPDCRRIETPRPWTSRERCRSAAERGAQSLASSTK
jgi:putative transposase